MPKSKTIFFIMNYGSSIRNLVKGGVLEALADKGYDFVLFHINDRDKKEAQAALGDKVAFDDLGETPFRGKARALQRLKTYHWRTTVAYNEHLMREARPRTLKHEIQDLFGKLILKWIPYSWWDKGTQLTAEWPEAKRLLSQYNPIAVMISNPVANENCVLNYCRSKGIYTACLVESWDNLSNRGALYCYPQTLMLWSQFIKDQAVLKHGYPEEQVHVSGIPSYDIYFKENNIPIESDWRKNEGLPPDQPIILYSTSSKLLYRGEDRIIQSIIDAMHEGKLPSNTHLLIRIHPRDDLSLYDKFKNQDRVTIQIPGTLGQDYLNDDTFGEPHRLAATVRYSAVGINAFSTMCLDLLANGTPIVMTSFDFSSKSLPLHKSIRRHLTYQHIKDLAAFDAIPLPESIEELIDHVNHFLKDPDWKLKERQTAAQAELYALDGKSIERAVTTLDSEIKKFYRNHLE